MLHRFYGSVAPARFFSRSPLCSILRPSLLLLIVLNHAIPPLPLSAEHFSRTPFCRGRRGPSSQRSPAILMRVTWSGNFHGRVRWQIGGVVRWRIGGAMPGTEL